MFVIFWLQIYRKFGFLVVCRLLFDGVISRLPRGFEEAWFLSQNVFTLQMINTVYLSKPSFRGTNQVVLALATKNVNAVHTVTTKANFWHSRSPSGGLDFTSASCILGM